MLTVDEHIQLAETIAGRLPGVSRNEWMRWVQVAFTQGLEPAIEHARHLSRDVTMRPAIQRANDRIAQAVTTNKQALASLSPEERRRVLGYVGWWLKVRESERKQSDHAAPGKPTRGKSPR